MRVTSTDPESLDSSTKSTTLVQFVVPAHNEEKHLGACLDSVCRQRLDSSQWDRDGQRTISFVVVDNQSTDGTAQIARDKGGEVISIVPGNAGRARNAGANLCNAQFIAFVDADCVLPPDWLQRCLVHFQQSDVIAVGSVQALADDDAPWVEREWLATTIKASTDESERVEWLPAFNLILRGDAFRSIGGFNEALETCEDSDLSFRLSEQGVLIRDYTCPVRHLGESRTVSEFFRREMWRSRGNFRSALNRGTAFSEAASLFVPIGFLVLLLFASAFLFAAIRSGGFWGIAALIAWGMVIAIAVVISILKRGRHISVQTPLLISIYLIARGLGPMVPARRVKR